MKSKRTQRGTKRSKAFGDKIRAAADRRRAIGLYAGPELTWFRCVCCDDICAQESYGHRRHRACAKQACKTFAANQTKAARGKLPDTQIVVDLYLSGLTAKQIGKMYHCSDTTVLQALKHAGCPIRPATRRARSVCKEEGCEKPVYLILHARTQQYYGTRCHEHHVAHKQAIGRAYMRRLATQGKRGKGKAHKLRGKRRTVAFKHKVIAGQKRRQAYGLHVGRPRKRVDYWFSCEECGVLVCDQRGNEQRVACKACRPIVAAKHRRKLPQDGTVAALYLEGLTTTEIAQRFNSNHKSVRQELERAGIARRRSGQRQRIECKRRGCHKPVYRKWHAVHKKFHGTLCEEHFYQQRKEYSKKRWLKIKAQRAAANTA